MVQVDCSNSSRATGKWKLGCINSAKKFNFWPCSPYLGEPSTVVIKVCYRNNAKSSVPSQNIAWMVKMMVQLVKKLEQPLQHPSLAFKGNCSLHVHRCQKLQKSAYPGKFEIQVEGASLFWEVNVDLQPHWTDFNETENERERWYKNVGREGSWPTTMGSHQP